MSTTTIIPTDPEALRAYRCECGSVTEVYRWEGAQDFDCRCGRMYNTYGQQVTCALEDIDPSWAGERWDDD